MNITINKDPKTIDTDSHLLQLLESVKLIDQKGVAIAVNDQVITRGNWEQFKLKENDKITIIKATQGG
ncbi:sulfur carrier protein ThiS [bacterium AH-315-M05]|nr:sulfur carrier protein ThiS [bacterium AH-315-M05]